MSAHEEEIHEGAGALRRRLGLNRRQAEEPGRSLQHADLGHRNLAALRRRR